MDLDLKAEMLTLPFVSQTLFPHGHGADQEIWSLLAHPYLHNTLFFQNEVDASMISSQGTFQQYTCIVAPATILQHYH